MRMVSLSPSIEVETEEHDDEHARFAYFFAPDCEAGLDEVARVVRTSGAAFIIDDDLRNGTFARWLSRHPTLTEVSADDSGAIWQDYGYQLIRIPSAWQFQHRADLEAVVKLEFGAALGAELLKDHHSLQVEYHYCL